jgi:hypothetical protein
LAVSTGRGVSANADWVANKTIALPDGRGRVIAGLDDMGNSAAGRLTATYFGAAATALGAVGGGESQTLTLAQTPTGINSTGAVNVSTAGISGVVQNAALSSLFGTTGAGAPAAWTGGAVAAAASTAASGVNVFTSNNTSGLPHPIVQPTILTTFYIKL